MTSTWGVVACADATLTSCPSLEAAIVVSSEFGLKPPVCAACTQQHTCSSGARTGSTCAVVSVGTTSDWSVRREFFCRYIHTALVVAWHGALVA